MLRVSRNNGWFNMFAPPPSLLVCIFRCLFFPTLHIALHFPLQIFHVQLRGTVLIIVIIFFPYLSFPLFSLSSGMLFEIRSREFFLCYFAFYLFKSFQAYVFFSVLYCWLFLRVNIFLLLSIFHFRAHCEMASSWAFRRSCTGLYILVLV
ncbi:hypothetical protein BJ508DRAFT_143976 [Ascobolus immersus RN42]|uniref:Uncharacterized protein n=1 Tax=Ascobolus immersus RN42 TaxID=1160509 RepID=A0A3N4HZ58_ASCIM|nr:hypothetical protein BJ508DRAFT_143976 [Ascobolus immersus RN42]